MTISVYSFITSLLWFTVFAIISHLTANSETFVERYSTTPLLFIMILAIFRMYCSVEFPITTVIRSHRILPAIHSAMTYPLFSQFGIAVTPLLSLLVLWWGGALFFIMRLIRQYVSVIRAVNDLPARIYDKVAERIGPDVRVIRSKKVDAPFMVGLFRMTLFLPEYTISDDQLEYVLLHERQHFSSRHTLIKMAANVLLCILWWHPAVYILRRDIDQSLEIDCDMKVTGDLSDADKLDYLDSMLNMIKMAKAVARPLEIQNAGSGFVDSRAKSAQVKKRFRLVLSDRRRTRTKGRVVLYIAMLVALCVSFMFIVQPYITPPVYDCEEVDRVSEITKENAYLVLNEDGTFSLYVDGQYQGVIDYPDTEPFNGLMILE